MWLRDTGVLTKLRYDVLNPPILIPDPKVRNNQPLNNWQLGIIMIIYLVGVMIVGWKQYDHFCQITAGPPSIFIKWSYLMKKCQPPSRGSNTKMRMRHLCTSILLKTEKFNFSKTPHVANQSTRNLTLISKMYTFMRLS